MPRSRAQARESLVGLFLVHRALVEAELEEEVECIADDRPGLDAEERHHPPAVEGRPDAIELLLLAQPRDALLELVDAPVQRPRLRLVPRRAVLTDEMVERLEQRTGVAHVPAHRPVGPSHRIGVDPQMEVDETRDVVDEIAREPERS